MLNSDIAIESFDKKAPQYHPSVVGWKGFQHDVFLVWAHSREGLDLSFNLMKNIDSMKKTQFIMEVAKDILKFLDLRLKFDKKSKRISIDIFSKATNSFTYVLPSTCFLKNNIENIPKGVALRLRRIVILTLNLRSVVENTKNI